MTKEQLDRIRRCAAMTLNHDDMPPLARGVIGGDVPALLDEVERLRIEVERLQREAQQAFARGREAGCSAMLGPMQDQRKIAKGGTP